MLLMAMLDGTLRYEAKRTFNLDRKLSNGGRSAGIRHQQRDTVDAHGTVDIQAGDQRAGGHPDDENGLGYGAGVEKNPVPPGMGAHVVGKWGFVVVEVVGEMRGVEGEKAPQRQHRQEGIPGALPAEHEAAHDHGFYSKSAPTSRQIKTGVRPDIAAETRKV